MFSSSGKTSQLTYLGKLRSHRRARTEIDCCCQSQDWKRHLYRSTHSKPAARKIQKKNTHNTIKPRRASLIYAYLVGALRWIDMYLYKYERDTKDAWKISNLLPDGIPTMANGIDNTFSVALEKKIKSVSYLLRCSIIVVVVVVRTIKTILFVLDNIFLFVLMINIVGFVNHRWNGF